MINNIEQNWKNYYYPADYEISEDGLLMYNGGRICGTPFVLCGKTPELSGGSRLYLVRYDFDGKHKEFLARTEELQQKKKCADLLTRHSFKVNDGRQFGRVLQYITDCMITYGNDLPVIRAVEQNGWDDTFDTFAIGNEGITEKGIISIHTTLTNPKHVDVFERKGTEKDWIEAVKPLFKEDLVRFLFYDAMSAPLIKLLGLESHAFEHCGKTRSGKTTISRIIASAIGNPTEMLMIPGSSEKGIIAHVEAMTDLPTFVEEATTKKAKEVTRAAIYDIANGMQKTRAQIDGKMREDIKTFKAVTHFTCEGSIREEMDHAGEMYRLNSIEEMLPYVEGISKINREIEQNHGFFFIRYVQEIIRNKDSLKAKYNEFYDSIIIDEKTKNKNLVESSKDLYTGIMVSGWLCEKVFKDMGIEEVKDKEGKVKDFKKIVQDYFQKCIVDNFVELDHIRSLRALNDWILQNDRAFLRHANMIQDLSIKEPYGVYDLDTFEIRIVGKQFTKIMKEWGFNSPSNIRKCLLEEGILRSNRPDGWCNFEMAGEVLTEL
jgi:putative DNA primase/helicase